MDLCVMIEGQEGVSWSQWKAIADACERHGIPALFRSDHYLPLDGHADRDVLDAWGCICGLAATTTILRLGTLVSPSTFRHPSVLAKLAATADQVSDGRIEIGLGAGWHVGEHLAFGFAFPPLRERIDILAEQLDILLGLWGPGGFSYSGQRYELATVDSQPKPVQSPMPLIIGGSAGPRSADLAARFANEYNTAFVTPAQVRERRETLSRACLSAGRDPATLSFSVMTGLVVGRDTDELAERTRRVAALRVEPDFQPPATWIHGTIREATAQLHDLASAGTDRVMLQLLAHDDLDQIALIGSELAPAVA
jgi:alkanesulfonate monooxygenase SsuD/methylene tetrahydromethanopterin reductase-like flavin-dependent oxidoreductase (luciferase family)